MVEPTPRIMLVRLVKKKKKLWKCAVRVYGHMEFNAPKGGTSWWKASNTCTPVNRINWCINVLIALSVGKGP